MQNNFFLLSKSCYENNYVAIDQNKINSILSTTDNYKFGLRSASRCRNGQEIGRKQKGDVDWVRVRVQGQGQGQGQGGSKKGMWIGLGLGFRVRVRVREEAKSGCGLGQGQGLGLGLGLGLGRKQKRDVDWREIVASDASYYKFSHKHIKPTHTGNLLIDAHNMTHLSGFPDFSKFRQNAIMLPQTNASHGNDFRRLVQLVLWVVK